MVFTSIRHSVPCGSKESSLYPTPSPSSSAIHRTLKDKRGRPELMADVSLAVASLVLGLWVGCNRYHITVHAGAENRRRPAKSVKFSEIARFWLSERHLVYGASGKEFSGEVPEFWQEHGKRRS